MKPVPRPVPKTQPPRPNPVWSEKHQRAFGAWMRACYERNVANGWPTAEQNARHASLRLAARAARR